MRPGDAKLSKLHRQRVEREKALFREPETFDDIIDHIGNGGTLAAWCKVQDVRYTAVHLWIAEDPRRASRYAMAMEARKAFLADGFLEDVNRIRTGDPRQAFDAKGKPLGVHELPDSVALVTREFDSSTVTTGKVTKSYSNIKMIGQEKGTEMLGKHLGLLVDRTELTGKGGGPVQFKELQRNLTRLTDAQLEQLQSIFTSLGMPIP